MKKFAFGFALLAVLSVGAARADDAKAVFEKKCAVCHGKDGHPTPMGQKMGAKDLTSLADPKADVAPVVASITNGKPPKMQAFKGKLTDAEIADLAKYIRNGMK
ncbi:MAG: c-type cytochrome [Anaeromyxobacteraceae bacterium]